MLNSYATYAGTELWNHERFMAYMAGNLAYGFRGLRQPNTSVNPNCYCSGAHCLFCDQGAGENGAYISPALDPAPWYDEDEPGSGEFAGLFVEEIVGFDSTVSRSVSEGAISGSSLGPLRLQGRNITVTGWLRAKTCCGAEFGLRWLQEALLGNNFCEDCAVNDLYMIKCCPPDDDTCHVRLAEETTLITDESVTVTITDEGAGVFTIVINDANRTNVISTEAGAANNVLGFIPVANAASHAWGVGLTPTSGSNAVHVLTIPFAIVTDFATADSGTGSMATIEIDTTIVSDCEDEQRQTTALIEILESWIDAYGSASAEAQYPVGFGREYEVVEGIDPQDYIRLFHRTGLTDGVKVLERHGTCCSACGCTNLKVQFTLTSELPYIYSDIKWCVEEEEFPEDMYCANLKKLCPQCGPDAVGTKTYERQVPRPSCGVTLRHDQTWCADGWDTEDNCPPEDCILTIAGTTEFTAEQAAEADGCEPGTAKADTCLVSLLADFTWAPTFPLVWNPVEDGFPPPYCDLVIDGSGVCEEADPGDPDADPPVPPTEEGESCLIRLIYNECTDEYTWEPLYWLGEVPFPEGCDCVEVAETCLIRCPDASEAAAPCLDPMECPVTINCDGTWTPVGWVHDIDAVFPDPDCTYVVANVQDTSPLIELVEIPADTFVPDCGPLPIQPPAPFLINTSCFCDPWVTRRVCCTFTNPGDWNDATSYIEIYTGSEEMRRLKIEAYPNPFGEAVPCPCDPADPFWECREPCSSILVPQLPAGSKLIIDSRLHTAQLVLAGGKTVSAMRYIFAEDGAPFEWFDIAQCSTFCIIASADAQFVADDAYVSIGMINRYTASGW